MSLQTFRNTAFAVALFFVATLASRSASAYEFGLSFGPFLPIHIGGTREVMNGWAGRVGIPSERGNFEIEYFNAHGSGVHYHTLAFDYRLDLISRSNTSGLSEFPVHFLLGFHADSYQPLDQSTYNTSGGWHYGGGLQIPLGGPQSAVAIRAEFKHRFSPGTSLIVLVGLNFFTGSSDAGTP